MGTDDEDGDDSEAGVDWGEDCPPLDGCLVGVLESPPPLLCGGCPPLPPSSLWPGVSIQSVSAIFLIFDVLAFTESNGLSYRHVIYMHLLCKEQKTRKSAYTLAKCAPKQPQDYVSLPAES